MDLSSNEDSAGDLCYAKSFLQLGGHKPGNMENLENSGNLKNCQNLRESSGKFELL